MDLQALTQARYQKSVEDCTDQEIYFCLLEETGRLCSQRKPAELPKKKLYYISAEFLIGKLLSNNLINLGIYDEVREQLTACGKRLSAIEEVEPEPSLGNGGLGRLAACFLDSIAALGLPGDGIGLNYHFGLFRQVFQAHAQTAEPDPWIESASWLQKTDTVYPVTFGDCTVQARMYNILIPGYENNTTNMLHLFDVETIDESLIQDSISFDKTAIEKNLTLFLYPDDSDDAGRLLRVYQEYLMVSAGAQLILEECVARGCQLTDLSEYAVIQINDTHPSMIIPELIRLMIARGVSLDAAIQAVEKTCAYTNHTILAEALEKWPLSYLQQAVPQLVPILEILDDRVRRKYSDSKAVIIDSADTVHMAHLDIHYSFSVNGVASLHTEILKQVELHRFYELYPEKFNNKTNGITFRRWLLHCNPRLTRLIASRIGDDFRKDPMELEKLLEFRNDKAFLKELLEVKTACKQDLIRYLQETQQVSLSSNAIFDIQIKRLHEYKRQQMNALYVIHKYLEIKSGKKPKRPIAVIFGAKAAPAYIIAQDIIHLILCLQELISNDPEVSPWLQVVMVENYNVTKAEKLIPACDISEQISLASKEASGTGNMKFMLNGAVTLGTEDGANVEIHELVGDENIYVFGDSSEIVVERYAKGSYKAKEYYESNPAIQEAVDFITGEELLAIGDSVRLERLSKELIGKDWFMTFPDFDAYVEAREQAYVDYEDRLGFAEKMLVNIAKSGYFSSDRTIAEYNRDIWHLEARN